MTGRRFNNYLSIYSHSSIYIHNNCHQREKFNVLVKMSFYSSSSMIRNQTRFRKSCYYSSFQFSSSDLSLLAARFSHLKYSTRREI